MRSHRRSTFAGSCPSSPGVRVCSTNGPASGPIRLMPVSPSSVTTFTAAWVRRYALDPILPPAANGSTSTATIFIALPHLPVRARGFCITTATSWRSWVTMSWLAGASPEMTFPMVCVSASHSSVL